MNKLKTIVVEDERLPRLSLLQKLEEHRHAIEVVDACDSFETARQSILKHRPDLLFLDIQLRGRDSIAMLEELKHTIPLPYVIFTTAYSDRRYLMSAIKLSAVDYLLKPVDKGELAHAIAKVTDRHHTQQTTQLTGMDGKLVFRTATGRLIVDANDVAFLRSDGNYAKVATFRRQETVLDSLATLERKLPPDSFLRIDRSLIINVRHLYRLVSKQRLCVLLAPDGTEMELSVSKSGMETLSQLLYS